MEIEVNHNHGIISIFVAFGFDWTGLQPFQLTKNMQVSIRGYSECCQIPLEKHNIQNSLS